MLIFLGGTKKGGRKSRGRNWKETDVQKKKFQGGVHKRDPWCLLLLIILIPVKVLRTYLLQKNHISYLEG